MKNRKNILVSVHSLTKTSPPSLFSSLLLEMKITQALLEMTITITFDRCRCIALTALQTFWLLKYLMKFSWTGRYLDFSFEPHKDHHSLHFPCQMSDWLSFSLWSLSLYYVVQTCWSCLMKSVLPLTVPHLFSAPASSHGKLDPMSWSTFSKVLAF